MKYSTIRIVGSILSADILDKIGREELSGQKSSDFGFPATTKVKDEIARAWADAQDIWRVYKRRIGRLSEADYGTSETRKFWIIPLLEMFGFDTVLSKAESVNGKTYAVSHRAKNIDMFPLHIMGFRDSLDKKRTDSGPRMSPHGLVQEYLNLTEHLYAIVSNGTYLRLLRDSSRLIKLSFIEFDLAAMMDDEHFADFAIMYRLLHATRMPQNIEQGGDCLIEQYHQDALDSGSRIRSGLSQAVKNSICMLGEGFLAHSDNVQLRKIVEEENIDALKFYEYLLKLIYRLLFLMVIEERDLVYPKGCNKTRRQIYYSYYSLANLRQLSEKPYLLDHRFCDLWILLKNCFSLFDTGGKGDRLDIKPLAGDLFGYDAIGILNDCNLDNKTLLTCLNNLNIFENPVTRQKMRVNYGSLNVEEFGSVYEGLLEKAPFFQTEQGRIVFGLKAGSERSSSGSHYTPDELVQPLIKHSLDHIILDKLKNPDPVSALLSIKVCDVACGSGHILLNAARRIGGEVAKIRSGEEQPSPEPFRQGVRDAIGHCIYGVDKNPLAVELCKVALWLEAHEPGKPLSFLDHHIKCGDAIVGLAHKEELENGIANEAFKNMPEDDKSIRANLAKRNKNERKTVRKREEFYSHTKYGSIEKSVFNVSEYVKTLNTMPENTPEEVAAKKGKYKDLTTGPLWWHLKNIADIQVAQFFIPKIEENFTKVITDDEFRRYLTGKNKIHSQSVELATTIADEKRFFHWFLEFPVVFANGGFDCILGNPPYLGGKKINAAWGHKYLNIIHYLYPKVGGQADLVTYFLRQAYNLIKPKKSLGLIVTNSICEGDTRSGGLDEILNNEGFINYAVKSLKWPGIANLFVSLLCIHKNDPPKTIFLDNKIVPYINSYFGTTKDDYVAKPLLQNSELMFRGVDFGGDGFIIDESVADKLLMESCDNNRVIFRVINGQEINNIPSQEPSKYIINFTNLTVEEASKYNSAYEIVKNKVKPYRDGVENKTAKEKWWLYNRSRPNLYKKLEQRGKCIVTAFTSKYLSFSICDSNFIFTNALNIFASDEMFKFSILHSNIHEAWVRKYASKLKNDLRYTPSDCFETFPFPQNITAQMEHLLTEIGEQYNVFRSRIMNQTELGLTKTYNLFHTQKLTTEIVQQASQKDEAISVKVISDIIRLRELHNKMDKTVVSAYGWTDINLDHGFYEVDYLPENDRVHYTISPGARKKILNRLLKLNHEIHQTELLNGVKSKEKLRKVIKIKKEDTQLSLFD